MTTPYDPNPNGYAARRPRCVISGPEGFLRAVILVTGRLGGAQIERVHVNNVNDALHLCTRDAAAKLIGAIDAHYPVTTGYTVLEDVGGA